MEKTSGRICQSCAMSMSKLTDFGSEIDGSPNDDFCLHCYNNGKYTWPDAVLSEFTDKIVSEAPRMNMTAEQARELTKTVIPNLKRWKK